MLCHKAAPYYYHGLSKGKKKEEEEQEVAPYNSKYLTILTNLKEMIYFFLGTSQ